MRSCGQRSRAAAFYAFAEQCIQWAKDARSPQERDVYVRLAIQWLDAGARLQTCFEATLQERNASGRPSSRDDFNGNT